MNTIKSSAYTPSGERTDDVDHVLGDVTYVRFEECDHVVLGNPTMSYKVGSKMTCRQCEFHVTEANGPRQQECIDSAITTAHVTGSIGATCSIGGDNTEESSATVRRAS